MLTEEEKKLVRETWEPVSQDPEAAASLFYGRLFEVAPAVKPLFTGDMSAQGKKLMQMIGVAVNNLDRIDDIVPALQALGERHVGYGAEPEHYPVVGSVLLDTLETALGDAFTPEARGAWTKTYGALASVMTDEAAG